MTEEKTNNQPLDSDKEQSNEGLVEAEDYDKLSTEDLKKLAKGEKLTPVTPAPATEPAEELPDYVKGKTAEEIAKDYVNLRKKLDEQGKEVGELRKFKDEAVTLDNQMKQYQIDATSRHIMKSEVKKMTDEEKQRFYDVFSEDPVEALMPYIEKMTKPLAVVQARQANENEINSLKEKYRDSRVPYDEKAVNKIIANHTGADGRNKLFDIHGTKAFEEAYKIHRDANLDAAIERENKEFQEKALKEAEEQAKKKLSTYTEPQGAASVPSGSTDYDTMPMEELERLIGKPKD